jgi:hypothetical protein
MSFPAFGRHLIPALQVRMKIGDSRLIRNVGNYVPNCTASQQDIYLKVTLESSILEVRSWHIGRDTGYSE